MVLLPISNESQIQTNNRAKNAAYRFILVFNMDIRELEKFFDYKPFLDQDPQIILDKIILKARKYLPEEQIPGIHKAYAYAAEKHQ